eukprot:scaffold23492_cov65-Phaeocystis_antarctica.AAC.8
MGALTTAVLIAGAARARGDQLPPVPHGLDQRPQLRAPARRRRGAERRRLRPLRGARRAGGRGSCIRGGGAPRGARAAGGGEYTSSSYSSSLYSSCTASLDSLRLY